MSFELFRSTRRAALAAFAGAALAGGALTACSSSAPTATARPGEVRLNNFPSGVRVADQSTLDSLKAVARSLAKSANCPDGSCGVVSLGAKPCGGPWEYVQYCPTTTDVPRLEAVANEVQRAEVLFNERYGLASDCMMAQLPACTAKSTR
jgi:hypothetical protein